jgi:hypothetical protein
VLNAVPHPVFPKKALTSTADAVYFVLTGLKTIWATMFVGFVMLPGAIYLGLVTGGAMTGAAQWVTVIVFLEIAKRSARFDVSGTSQRSITF